METVRFPWDRVHPGSGFFVPCLDVQKMRMLGLREAMHHGMEAEATAGIYGGRFGLWFFRVR